MLLPLAGCPLLPDEACASLLLRYYEDSEHSVTSLLAALQRMYMQHFREQGLSSLVQVLAGGVEGREQVRGGAGREGGGRGD